MSEITTCCYSDKDMLAYYYHLTFTLVHCIKPARGHLDLLVFHLNNSLHRNNRRIIQTTLIQIIYNADKNIMAGINGNESIKCSVVIKYI